MRPVARIPLLRSSRDGIPRPMVGSFSASRIRSGLSPRAVSLVRHHSFPSKPTATPHHPPAAAAEGGLLGAASPYLVPPSAAAAGSPLPTSDGMRPLPPTAPSPLSILPLGMLLRNLLTSVVTASPILLPPSLRLLSWLAHSTGAILNPDRNPALRLALKRTLYGQFCAGENGAEVARTMARLKNLGFRGVVLSYGKEVVLSREEQLGSSSSLSSSAAQTATEISAWRGGNLETVRLARAGDFVALKFTGAGRQVYVSLAAGAPPPDELARAIDDICVLAISRGVRLLIDAEQTAVQAGIDDWGMRYLRKYNSGSGSGNKTTPARAHVYLTYQAYLKRAPETIRAHLEMARREGFTLGVKLVRGAYLATDPRHLIHDTKSDTDRAFDDLTASLLTGRWSQILAGEGPFPLLSLIVASHNAESVGRARAIVESGRARCADVSFAQLQGMADEVSCGLLGSGDRERRGGGGWGVGGGGDGGGEHGGGVAPSGVRPGLGAYKYLVWGSTADCMKYLLRRAEENRDAVQRTRSGRDAMWAEVTRRLRSIFRLG